MKKLILLFAVILFYLHFSPSQVFADFTQEVDACNKTLANSSSLYCTIKIDADLGDGVYLPNAYVEYKSGPEEAKSSLEKQYQDKLQRLQIKTDETDLWEKATKILEEASQDNMKFIITQRPNIAKGTDFVYEFSSTLFTQQGSCVIRLDNTAHTRYGKNQYNQTVDINGDADKMKAESVSYMRKVIDGLREGCKPKNGSGIAIATGFVKKINIPSNLIKLTPSISIPAVVVIILFLIIVFSLYWIFVKHMIKNKSFFTSKLFFYILIVLLLISIYLLLKGIFFKE